jgi:hypothetical protein
MLATLHAAAALLSSACCLLSAVNLSHCWLCILILIYCICTLCGRSENPISQIDLGAHENMRTSSRSSSAMQLGPTGRELFL